MTMTAAPLATPPAPKRTTRPWTRTLPLLLAASAGALSATPAPAVDTDWILQALVQPVPSHTDFVELRDSRLLKAPLRLAGEYRRPRADTLVREVRTPYVETTTITSDAAGTDAVGTDPLAAGGSGGGEIIIARAGKPPRRFALARAPELHGLQASFGALLAGDRQALEQHYRLASTGSRAHWVLTLTPKQAVLAAKLHDIALYGRDTELRCIETRPARGATSSPPTQRTLLAGAARAANPSLDAAALLALCHGNGSPR
jgi:hypothetical protein